MQSLDEDMSDPGFFEHPGPKVIPEIALFLDGYDIKIQPVNAQAQSLMIQNLEAVQERADRFNKKWTGHSVDMTKMLVMAAEFQDWFRQHVDKSIIIRAKQWQTVSTQQELVDL